MHARLHATRQALTAALLRSGHNLDECRDRSASEFRMTAGCRPAASAGGRRTIHPQVPALAAV